MTRASIAAMTAYTLELREAGTKLNQNENPFDVPAELKRTIADEIVARAWNRYPDFESGALRNAIAEAHGLEPDNILTGNGSNELLAAAIGTFVGPGTPVVIPRPTFTLYEKLVTVAGGSVIPVTIDPRNAGLPLDAMVSATASQRDAVVIVCSPNNPTGGTLPSGGIARLLETGATILFDRAYGDFAHNPKDRGPGDPLSNPEDRGPRTEDRHPTTEDPVSNPEDRGPRTEDRFIHDRFIHDRLIHHRLVTFSTFSKAWGLAGLRVGWLATTAQTAREIRKVKLPYSLNIFSEAAAIAALAHRSIRDANVAAILAERDRVREAMLGIATIETFPSAANFIAFRTQRPSKQIFDAVLARGILIRDISGYPALANCLRVSIGTPEENDRFIEALREVA